MLKHNFQYDGKERECVNTLSCFDLGDKELVDR
jgi:hypothetical protein